MTSLLDGLKWAEGVALSKVGAEIAKVVEGEVADPVQVSVTATAPFGEHGMPHDSQARKETPVATGVLAYFPDAIAEVAKVSFIGNQKHNPGEPLHWARGKSTDQTDAAVRHIMDYLTGARRDKDGSHVLAQTAWRILAELQLDIEKSKEGAK